MKLVERHVNRLIRSVSFISEAHAVLELSNPVRYSSLKDILPIGLEVDVNEYEKNATGTYLFILAQYSNYFHAKKYLHDI